MAGVIPPIFASSIILFPATLGSWFGSTEGMEWLKNISSTLSPGQPVYVLCYAVAIMFFCFFYTALMFNPKDTADNLKRSGAFALNFLGRDLYYGGVFATGVHDCVLECALLFRWYVIADHGGGSDGFYCAGAVTPHVAPV